MNVQYPTRNVQPRKAGAAVAPPQSSTCLPRRLPARGPAGGPVCVRRRTGRRRRQAVLACLAVALSRRQVARYRQPTFPAFRWTRTDDENGRRVRNERATPWSLDIPCWTLDIRLSRPVEVSTYSRTGQRRSRRFRGVLTRRGRRVYVKRPVFSHNANCWRKSVAG